MGGQCSKKASSTNHPEITDFVVYRSIGRGSFGRVCIVQHKNTKKLYAMKCVDKRRCVQRMASNMVLSELDLLSQVSHTFIVNLWFAFQDSRHMYMVSDLLLGGDLRYHLNQQGRFSEDRAKLYACEVALALQYLHGELIVHRDVKPENIILDDHGHAHLTDFNLATRLGPNTLATSFSGTRPYMAPEIIISALQSGPGYDHRVDWFSLGICFYETLMGRVPFEYTTEVSSEQVLLLMKSSMIALPAHWSSDLISFITSILRFNPNDRISSLASFSNHRYMERIDMNAVLNRRTAPVFIPRTDSLNCDPTHELEMRIIGSSATLRGQSPVSRDAIKQIVEEISRVFPIFNRQMDMSPQKNSQVNEAETSFVTACEWNCA